MVESGDRRLDLETINLSPCGAKIRLDHPVFELGTPAYLHFDPPYGGPLDVHAIVWRSDPDGSAFFFIEVEGDGISFPLESSPVDSPLGLKSPSRVADCSRLRGDRHDR